METVQLLSFRYNHDPSQSRCVVDWNRQDPSECLNCQIVNNYMGLSELEMECLELKKDPWTSDPKRDICLRYLSFIKEYKTILDFDEVVLNNGVTDLDLHSIVVVYQGKYYGHLYIWRSNYNSDTFIVFGARCRVDDLFVDDALPNTINYLFEGVRRHVLANKGDKFIILYPVPRIESILKKMSASRVIVPKEYIHEEILGEETCSKCYQITDLNNPFIILF